MIVFSFFVSSISSVSISAEQVCNKALLYVFLRAVKLNHKEDSFFTELPKWKQFQQCENPVIFVPLTKWKSKQTE